MRLFIVVLSSVVLAALAVGCGKDPGTPLKVPSQPAVSHDQPGAAAGTGTGTTSGTGTDKGTNGQAKSPVSKSGNNAGKDRKGSSKSNANGNSSGSNDGTGQNNGGQDSAGQNTQPPPQNPEAKKVVVGMGTTSTDPKDLFDRGLDAAIFEARVCSITGKFSDGSRCFVVYSDNSVEWVGPQNRAEVLHFIARLNAEKARREAEKNQNHQK